MRPPVKSFEPVTAEQIRMIGRHLGLGAVVARLGEADPAKGAGVIDGSTKCLWTRDGKRITISFARGTTIASCDKEPDPECPL